MGRDWRQPLRAGLGQFLPRTTRQLLLAVAWFAVVITLFSQIAKEWDRDEWVHHGISGLLLVPLAILFARLYKGGGGR